MRRSRRADVRDAALISVAFWIMVLALWLDVRFVSATLERISTHAMYIHVDFDTFWRSAVAFLEGRDVYDTGARLENLNPPFWILLLAPLGFLEPLLAYRVFTLITLALGQIYPILALGLVAAWAADRRNRPALSGGALGLIVALKPSLGPVLLWPLVRRRWGALGGALVSATATTLVGAVVVGPEATLDWLRLLSGRSPSPYWDNASLPGAAARLFTNNEFAAHITTVPWAIPVAYALGVGAIAITAARAGRDSEVGLWALVAASLLASPIAWHNYLVLLGPGVLLLLGRGQAAPAFLLLALQSIPPQWPLLWSEKDTVVASLALTLYLYILIAHWLVLLFAAKEPAGVPEPALDSGGVKGG